MGQIFREHINCEFNFRGQSNPMLQQWQLHPLLYPTQFQKDFVLH